MSSFKTLFENLDITEAISTKDMSKELEPIFDVLMDNDEVYGKLATKTIDDEYAYITYGSQLLGFYLYGGAGIVRTYFTNTSLVKKALKDIGGK